MVPHFSFKISAYQSVSPSNTTILTIVRWHHPISLFLKHIIMMGHAKVSQTWGAFEDLQLDQSFIHLNELSQIHPSGMHRILAVVFYGV